MKKKSKNKNAVPAYAPQIKTVKQVKTMLKTTKDGTVMNTLQNYVTILQHDPQLYNAIHLNEMSCRVHITRDLGWARDENGPLTDTDVNNIRFYLDSTYGISAEKQVVSAIDIVANEKRYHPIKDVLFPPQWDGKERIPYVLHHFLGAEVNDFNYKVPYNRLPKDRPRQCIFGGSGNKVAFLPLDRTGNRRFLPILIDMSKAEVHILEDEHESERYIQQVWAEALRIYAMGEPELKLPEQYEKELTKIQRYFMPEDDRLGMIIGYLESNIVQDTRKGVAVEYVPHAAGE